MRAAHLLEQPVALPHCALAGCIARVCWPATSVSSTSHGLHVLVELDRQDAEAERLEQRDHGRRRARDDRVLRRQLRPSWTAIAASTYSAKRSVCGTSSTGKTRQSIAASAA